MVYPEEGGDASRYVNAFVELSKTTYSFNEFLNFIFSGENYADVVNPLISYILSRFTSDGRILLATYGMVFGFFYSRNLWYLFKHINLSASKITVLFVIAFALLDPIWKIGAFRFAVAIQVFLYGILPFLIEGDKKKLWISFTAILFHFSFITPVLVILIYLVVGNRPNLYFIVFISTFFISEINFNFIRDFLSGLPIVYEEKVTGYLTEDSYRTQLEGTAMTNWYISNYTFFLKYISTALVVVLFFKGKKFVILNNGFYNLWCFLLIYYSFANIIYLLPQGVRFYGVGNMLAFFMLSWLPFVGKLPILVQRVRFAIVPIVLVLIIVDIRKGFDFTGLFTLLGNPFIAIFVSGDTPLIDLIK